MRRALLWPVVVAIAVVACGVPEDEGPQELSADEVPFGLLTTAPTTTTTPVDLPPDREADLYFVNSDGELEPLVREVEDRSHQTVIETLLATDVSGLPANLTSNIPPDTTLLDVSVDGDVLTVDLSEQFTSIEGRTLIAAVAQIVFTASMLEGIDAVAFRRDGEPLAVGDEDGATQDDPVTPSDYNTLLA